jgi:aryl-alcohol dehydrogenase-like predicted oxidoreductase
MFTRDRFEREYLRLYSEPGMGTTIWSPLASGVLTGKYTDGVPQGSRMSLPEYKWLRERLETPEGRANIRKAAELRTTAERLGIPLSRLAIAWCLRNPHVSTVILGASSAEQLRDNLKSLEAVPALGDDVIEEIEGVLQNRPELPEPY